MVPITVEQLAAAQLDEMRRQTAELEKFARAGFADLPEATEGLIADEIARAFAPLGRALQRLADHLHEHGDELLQRAIGSPSAGAARRGFGPGVVDTTASRDAGTAALLRELRLLRQALERQREAAPPSVIATPGPGREAAAEEASLLARDVGVQIGRLQRMLERVQELFLALRGRRRTPRREELLAGIGALLDQLRICARAMEELRQRLRAERPGDEDSLVLLGRVEGELRRSRETLVALAEAVQGGGGAEAD